MSASHDTFITNYCDFGPGTVDLLLLNLSNLCECLQTELQVQGVVQSVVVVLQVVTGHWVTADDQLQSVPGLSDERHSQTAVKVSGSDVVHLCAHRIDKRTGLWAGTCIRHSYLWFGALYQIHNITSSSRCYPDDTQTTVSFSFIYFLESFAVNIWLFSTDLLFVLLMMFVVSQCSIITCSILS